MASEKLLFRLEQPHGTGDIFVTWQNGSGMYLATTGVDCMVNIFNRYGEVQDRIRLPTLCTGFSWDSDGDLLGIICQSSQLIVWDANSSRKIQIDVRLKDTMSCLVWAKKEPILAVGTVKGNVSIYNHNTSKRIPVIGKHTKSIICGAWNSENLLALGSEDKTLSISNLEGDTLKMVNLRGDPADVQFSEMKTDERAGGENTVSAIVGKKTLYLYNLLDPENPIELAFQQHYGVIVAHKWFGDGYILIGFSCGYIIAISTYIREVGQELFQIKNHKNTLTDIAICERIGKAATCGDNTIKIHDLSNLQETSSVLTLSQEAGVERINWCNDGQLFSVCTKSGSLNVYVTQVPLLTSVCPPRLALLSSLTEISIYHYTTDRTKLKPILQTLETEPSFIGIGQYHLAVGMNNRVWFYDLTRPQSDNEDDGFFQLKDRQYLGGISSIRLNQQYISVLFEGKIQLHTIEQPDDDLDRESIMFPDNNSITLFITCHVLTTDFLIYGTDMGNIIYFLIDEWNVAHEYKHLVGITDIYSDPAGTRLVFVDIKGLAYVYNAVINEALSIPQLPNKIVGVLWDSNINDRNIFIIFDEYVIYTYIYKKFSIYGASIEKLGETNLVSKQLPLLMCSGEVLSATSGGQLTQIILNTHDNLQIGIKENDSTILESNFNKQLALHRFQAALTTCDLLKSNEFYKKLALEALKYLEIELAIRIYRLLDDVSMVWSLERLLNIEDYKLLCGYIMMYLNDFDRAQDWFLNSLNPIAALEMRRDLLQWDEALNLAKKMAPEQIALISREYAQQLEFIGNYSEAYIHYEKGLQDDLSKEHTFICKAGICRTALQCKNNRHGLSIALELDNKQLYKECGEILEKTKQYLEAGKLFEKCENYDRAASNYIKLKHWTKIGELLPLIQSNKIHLQYAKAKEDDQQYEEACKAYYQAKDYDSVIRLQLEYLNNPEIAVELVQETKSIEGAKLVAQFFQRLNDYTSAIKFLVLSHCNDEAFDLARKYNKMQLYGEILLNTLTIDEINVKDFASIALYFENEQNSLLAGLYWYHAKEYHRAMKHLLKASKINSNENQAISIAIDVVASSHDELIANQLIEFLLGETDGIPKDAKYLFRLYMARKQYKEAAKSAIIIANEEQINGNYRNAHDVLFAMYQELKQNNIRVPNEMQLNLMLLHSYILVRLHVRRGDHLKGARLLIRVANNISKFPSHIVPILTSTVIECHRAGLKYASYKYATKLMQPEYRKNIDTKYIKKIEAVVRKPPKLNKDDNNYNIDPIEPMTPCPYCDNQLPETEINCNSCKNNIPFCIVTGRHIVSSDLTACPKCDLPAIRTEFLEILNTEDSCPMCSEKIDSQQLIKIDDCKPYLNID